MGAGVQEFRSSGVAGVQELRVQVASRKPRM
jgi:hypothetical protein